MHDGASCLRTPQRGCAVFVLPVHDCVVGMGRMWEVRAHSAEQILVYVHFGQMLTVIFQSGQILRSNYGGQKWSNLHLK
jgi:hypothetical protein